MDPTSFQPRDYEDDEFDLDIRVIGVDESDPPAGHIDPLTGGFITCNCSHHPPYTCNEACN